MFVLREFSVQCFIREQFFDFFLFFSSNNGDKLDSLDNELSDAEMVRVVALVTA